jgi:glyoxylase-like metal-dependent hydrolase (beta-lactamase superfamily II)
MNASLLLSSIAAVAALAVHAEVNKVEPLAPDVYFHEGDIAGKGHCNNGWVVFEDYVLVIDANFPSGAQEIIAKIKQLTPKPVRFAFNTHHHGDHAYGNQVWVDQGATPVAHTGVVEEMKKYEPGRWEDSAKSRKDVQNSKLKYPSVLFPKEMFFDDGTHRVELHHFGVAHTHGDGFAWLPKERILFTGDACVNGPYNYVGDGSITAWVNTLEEARKLKPLKVCPGHGPSGDASVLDNQQEFFKELLAAAKPLTTESPAEIKGSVDEIRNRLKQNERIARYVGDGFPAQLEKAVVELGGKKFLAQSVRDAEEQKHIQAHGHDEHDHDHVRPVSPTLRRSK